MFPTTKPTASVESQQHSHTANRQLHEGGIWTTEKGRKVISKLRSYAKLKDLLFTFCKEWIALVHLSLILIWFIFTVCLFWTLSVMGNTCFSFEDKQNLIPHLPEHFILQDSCRDLKTSFAKKSTTSYTVAKKKVKALCRYPAWREEKVVTGYLFADPRGQRSTLIKYNDC